METQLSNFSWTLNTETVTSEKPIYVTLTKTFFNEYKGLHTQVVPDVHLSAQSSDLNDALTQKVIGLPLQTLLHTRLDVIVFIPNPQLDTVRWIVALAAETGEGVVFNKYESRRLWWRKLTSVKKHWWVDLQGTTHHDTLNTIYLH